MKIDKHWKSNAYTHAHCQPATDTALWPRSCTTKNKKEIARAKSEHMQYVARVIRLLMYHFAMPRNFAKSAAKHAKETYKLPLNELCVCVCRAAWERIEYTRKATEKKIQYVQTAMTATLRAKERPNGLNKKKKNAKKRSSNNNEKRCQRHSTKWLCVYHTMYLAFAWAFAVSSAPLGRQSIGSRTIGHDLSTSFACFIFFPACHSIWVVELWTQKRKKKHEQ